jgi:hypothetical protein
MVSRRERSDHFGLHEAQDLDGMRAELLRQLVLDRLGGLLSDREDDVAGVSAA